MTFGQLLKKIAPRCSKELFDAILSSLAKLKTITQQYHYQIEIKQLIQNIENAMDDGKIDRNEFLNILHDFDIYNIKNFSKNIWDTLSASHKICVGSIESFSGGQDGGYGGQDGGYGGQDGGYGGQVGGYGGQDGGYCRQDGGYGHREFEAGGDGSGIASGVEGSGIVHEAEGIGDVAAEGIICLRQSFVYTCWKEGIL